MSKADLLKNKAKKSSPVASTAISKKPESDGRTITINFNDQLKRLSVLMESRHKNTIDICNILATMQDNQKELKEQTGLTFKDVITQYTTLSKSYFYSLVGQYRFLTQYNKTELVESIDTKVLEYIEKQPPEKHAELIEKAEKGDLRRADIKKKPESDGRTQKKSKNQINPEDLKGSGLSSISAAFSLLYSSIDFNPDQINKTKKAALNYLTGEKQQGGIIKKMHFTERQLKTLYDHIGELLK